jgi:hypothetical protein
MKLILNSRFLPNDLCLKWDQRISTLLALLVPVFAIAALLPASKSLAAASLVLLLGSIGGLLMLNRAFYRFLAARRGWSFAVRSMPLHVLYYFCCAGSAILGTLHHLSPGKSSSSSPVRSSPDLSVSKP